MLLLAGGRWQLVGLDFYLSGLGVGGRGKEGGRGEKCGWGKGEIFHKFGMGRMMS